MKNKSIHIKLTAAAALFVLTSFALSAAASTENRFKLKEGAKAGICLDCHETVRETIEKAHVHTPVRIGECSGCHNPHTSEHGKLLDEDINRLCFKCHKKVVPEEARSIHKIIVEDNCISCHDPHASDNEFVLIEKGNELCFKCHSELGDSIKNIKFEHEPVVKQKGCVSCHDPHASADVDFMLKDSDPALCLECHKSDKKGFAAGHMNYTVSNSRCTSCHNSHGSNTRGIIFDDMHEPVAKKECDKCHEGAASKTPLAIKSKGVELCRECHNEMITEMFGKDRVHWPLADKTGCLNCHNAHAAKQKYLLSGPVVDVCGKCHTDTVELQEISKNNPENKNLCEPVKKGNCIDCHTPHSSDNTLLIAEDSVSFGTCDKCHEWQTHSTHPIGENVIDPRNPNLIVDCLSCHKTCGTSNKRAMMHFDNTYFLCIQCHDEYRR